VHHLPDAIARAFVEANVYRLLLPNEPLWFMIEEGNLLNLQYFYIEQK